MATRTKLKPTLFAWGFVLTASPLAAAPQLRPDLQKSLASLLCQHPAEHTPSAAALWDQGIFDADLSIHHLRRRPSLAAHKPAQLAKLAYSFALRNRHLGFNYGTCDGDSAWLASVPAPQPLERSAADFQVPLTHYESHCQQLFFDFAASLSSSPTPESLSLSGERRLVLPSRPGMVSIACQPKRPSWLGPKPWFLIPSGEGSKELMLPEAARLEASSPSSLIHWVNAVRAIATLPPLAATDQSPASRSAAPKVAAHQNATPYQAVNSEALNRALSSLSLSQSLDHDRALLQTLGRSLQKQGWQALGENRVRAAGITEMATLLWYSPRHRRLLLNPEASHLSYVVQPTELGLFLVMLLAKKSELRISHKSLGHPTEQGRGKHAEL